MVTRLKWNYVAGMYTRDNYGTQGFQVWTFSNQLMNNGQYKGRWKEIAKTVTDSCLKMLAPVGFFSLVGQT